MADEPTWDDLFGEPLPEKPVQQPPVQPTAPQQPAAQQPVEQTPPPAQQTPSVPAPNVAPPAQAAAPSYPPTVTYPSAQQPPVQQPTYASTIKPPTYTPPGQVPADTTRGPSGGGPGGRRGRSRGGYEPEKPKRRLTWLWVLIILVVFGVAGTGVVYSAFGPQIRHILGMDPSIDYTGTGNGQATEITIQPGQYGSDVASSLEKAGVTKTATAFYDLLLKQKPAPVFEPGTYKLQKQMSAKSALAALSNSANRVVSKVVIPEGYNLTQVEARLAAKTGVKLTDLQAAATNYKQFKLPVGFTSLEGYLFPATYQFSPGTTAVQELQAMVTRMNQAMVQHKVPAKSAHTVLTLASIVQKESGNGPDSYKVSRVFTNRLAQHMALQSDATVSYGAHSSSIFTTGAQRADASNKYNTYAHTGLPIGPIAAPGDTAIDAALHPKAGPWLYFVLVNGTTGETVFSTNIAGQNAAIKQWHAWLKAHPGYGN